jgi:hypothetical protein
MAAQIVRASYHALLPAALELARWAAPLLMVGWAVASGIGRAFVLRALIPGNRLRVVSLCLLQWLRVCALTLTWLAWFAIVRWVAARTITHLPPGAEPSMVAFAAWLICLSIGSFIVWALWSWILSIASVLIVADDRSADDRSLIPALAGSVRQGPLTTQLVEVNMVLGIVKLALIVLAMVFSAIPLPFEAQMSGNALHLWWLAVGVWYLVASDFFQVARLAAFVALRQSRPE